jgi:alpha-galactosidase
MPTAYNVRIMFRRRSPACAFLLAVLAVASSHSALAADSTVAQAPPMGWNSWDSYGTTVREEQVKANADWMAEHLAKYGWKYIVVDIQWYEPNAQGHDYKPGAPLTMDEYGRLMPAVNRFPSAANGAGFKPLADYVHSKGLKFGIHIMRGIP